MYKIIISMSLIFVLRIPAFSISIDPFADSCFSVRGDCDHSGGTTPVDITDLTYFVDFMFVGGAEPVCLMEGDIDASGELDISDLTWLIDYMFQGGPEPPPDPGIDYKMYFFGMASPFTYYSCGVLSNKLDSFYLAETAQAMAVSANGQRLYVATTNQTSVYDLATEELVAHLPYKAYSIDCSPDGELVALCHTDLVILRTSDYSVAYQDTTKIYDGVFSNNSLSFYAVANPQNGQPYYVRKIELFGDTLITNTWIPGGSIVNVAPSPDESHLYVQSTCGSFCYYFKVYEVAVDSVIYSYFLTPGSWDMAVTKDDQTVFFTNPGSQLIGPPAPCSVLYVYDVASKSVSEIPTAQNIGKCNDPDLDCLGADDIVLSPDGRWLVGCGNLSVGGPFRINVETMTPDRCNFLGLNVGVYYLCGPKEP